MLLMRGLPIGLAIVIVLVALPSCSSLTLERVDFGWPVESVLTVSDTNTIDDVRYAVTCSVARLAAEEFQDSTALRGAKLRLLRNTEGYYFLTGPKFKHVYIFQQSPRELKLKNALEVTKTGLQNPALNQRPPHVELIDGDTFKRLLTSDDIVEGKKQ